MTTPVARVGCRLEFAVAEPATVVLRVAPASTAGERREELLDVAVDGRPVAVRSFAGQHDSVVHVMRSPTGRLRIAYRATLLPARGSTASDPATSSELDDEQLTYLRQSRYCPSDVLGGFVAYELGHLPIGPELLEAVGSWVGGRLAYRSGSSGPLDSAIDSLLTGQGVCRDFAHLAITVLRALEVPARLVGVYAPGLSPMDFHAVVEAHVGGCWQILDPTRMAPRHTLVRVATGRDAADTPFTTVLGGLAELIDAEVSAETDGDLPVDDHRGVVTLA